MSQLRSRERERELARNCATLLHFLGFAQKRFEEVIKINIPSPRGHEESDVEVGLGMHNDVLIEILREAVNVFLTQYRKIQCTMSPAMLNALSIAKKELGLMGDEEGDEETDEANGGDAQSVITIDDSDAGDDVPQNELVQLVEGDKETEEANIDEVGHYVVIGNLRRHLRRVLRRLTSKLSSKSSVH